MSITRLTCPECGAGLKSPAGFTPGESVACPRCDATFRVPARSVTRAQAVEADDPEPEPARRVRLFPIVLGVVVILGVGGVLAYAYREQQRAEQMRLAAETQADFARAEAARAAVIREQVNWNRANNPSLDLGRAAGLLDGISGASGPAKPPPATRLHGTWRTDPTLAPQREIVYSPDGTFRDTIADGPNPRVISGTWKVVGGSGTKVLKVERSGGGPSPIRITFEGDELIHDGDEPGTTLVLKKG